MKFNFLICSLLITLFISGCVVYPKEVRTYDPKCNIETRRLELRTEGVNVYCSGSSGRDAGACAVALIAVGAATAIVSGSIVVVGNFVYWLEELGTCNNVQVIEKT